VLDRLNAELVNLGQQGGEDPLQEMLGLAEGAQAAGGGAAAAAAAGGRTVMWNSPAVEVRACASTEQQADRHLLWAHLWLCICAAGLAISHLPDYCTAPHCLPPPLARPLTHIHTGPMRLQHPMPEMTPPGRRQQQQPLVQPAAARRRSGRAGAAAEAADDDDGEGRQERGGNQRRKVRCYCRSSYRWHCCRQRQRYHLLSL
jgi:hypothetical protein